MILAKYSFSFKESQETFNHAVIPTIAFTAHSAFHLVFSQIFLKTFTVMLIAVIQMKFTLICLVHSPRLPDAF